MNKLGLLRVPHVNLSRSADCHLQRVLIKAGPSAPGLHHALENV